MSPQAYARTLLLGSNVLDTETTGLNDQAEIVEISIIDQHGCVLLDTLVKPQRPIPADATDIHGITNAMVSTAPTWPEIHSKVSEIVSGKPLVIYNADYDMRLIAQTARRYGLAPITADAHCAMLAYAEFWGEWDHSKNDYRWQRLTAAAEQQGVVMAGQAHRALADVRMTLGVLQAMAANP